MSVLGGLDLDVGWGWGASKEVFNINTFFQAKAEAEAKKFPVKHLKKKVPIEVLNEF